MTQNAGSAASPVWCWADIDQLLQWLIARKCDSDAPDPGPASLLVQPDGAGEVGSDVEDRPEPSGTPCIGSRGEEGATHPLPSIGRRDEEPAHDAESVRWSLGGIAGEGHHRRGGLGLERHVSDDAPVRLCHPGPECVRRRPLRNIGTKSHAKAGAARAC